MSDATGAGEGVLNERCFVGDSQRVDPMSHGWVGRPAVESDMPTDATPSMLQLRRRGGCGTTVAADRRDLRVRRSAILLGRNRSGNKPDVDTVRELTTSLSELIGA